MNNDEINGLSNGVNETRLEAISVLEIVRIGLACSFITALRNSLLSRISRLSMTSRDGFRLCLGFVYSVQRGCAFFFRGP